MLDCCCLKEKTADEMRISDWSSDVCSSDLSSKEISLGEPQVCAPGFYTGIGGTNGVLHASALIEREGEVCVCTGCAQRGRKAVRGANDEFLIIGGCAQRRACSRLGDGHAFVGGAKTGPCRRQAGGIGRASCRDRVCQYV